MFILFLKKNQACALLFQNVDFETFKNSNPEQKRQNILKKSQIRHAINPLFICLRSALISDCLLIRESRVYGTPGMSL